MLLYQTLNNISGKRRTDADDQSVSVFLDDKKQQVDELKSKIFFNELTSTALFSMLCLSNSNCEGLLWKSNQQSRINYN